MDWIDTIKKKLNRLTLIFLYAGMGWVVVMMLLTTFDVTGRYFMSKPIPGANELSEFMLAVFGILGMAYTQISGSNVRVTMLTKALPEKIQGKVESLTAFLSFQITAVLSWYGMVMGIEELEIGTTTDTLGIPLYPLYFLLSLGAGLLSLVILIEFIEVALGLSESRKKTFLEPGKG